MEERTPTVLLADDEIHIRSFIKALLKSVKYEVIGEAGNGKEAIDLYRQLKPDMVLMDINMPVKTGSDALAEIVGEYPDAAVVMLTSLADVETVEECISRGAVGFIRKDTPVNEMKTLIQETWRDIALQRG